MRTIVISDIHGCYDELKSLLYTLEEKGEYNKETDKLIFLGDYIDRGADSKLVIALIRNLQENNSNVIALMGNHEDMLIDYCKGMNSSWTFNGYEDTLKSYMGCFEQFENDVEWMKNLPLYHEDNHFIYVHAGVDISKPMHEQNKHTLLWTRNEFIYNETMYYKQVIFGHTPTVNLNGKFKPTYTDAFNVDIDTGCVYGGALTALIIDDDEVSGFYQVNKNMEKIDLWDNFGNDEDYCEDEYGYENIF